MAATPKNRWLEFWQKLGAKHDPEPFFEQLKVRYSEPQRAYHNLAHVMDCLNELTPAMHLVHDPVAVEMAIWYHDYVYDTRAKDNEERSCEVADKVCAAIDLPTGFKSRVNSLILATKKHDPSLDRDAPLVVDVDLSILGRSPLRFDEYERQIRKEYDWASDEAFATGRTEVLKNFLARPVIFTTELFRERFERQARENLKRSISNLKNQKPGT